METQKTGYDTSFLQRQIKRIDKHRCLIDKNLNQLDEVGARCQRS